MKRLRLVLVFALVVLLGLASAAPVLAATGRSGNDVVIAANETIGDDLYLSGATITVDGTVQGDLVAVGGTITVNGHVEGTLLAAGQAVIINGTVDGTARAAGQGVQVGPQARISRDVVVLAYSFESKPGAAIGRDLMLTTAKARVDGSIGRDLLGSLEGIELLGTVGRNVDLQIVAPDTTTPSPSWLSVGMPLSFSDVAAGVALGSGAAVAGKLHYEAVSRSESVGAGQVAGGVAYSEKTAVGGNVRNATAALLIDQLQRLLSLLLVGLVLLWLLPRWTQRLAAREQTAALASLGWGALVLLGFVALVLGVAVVAVLLGVLLGLLTLGGLLGFVLLLGAFAESLLIFGFGLFSGFIAPVVLSYVVGAWLLRQLSRSSEVSRYWAVVLGVAVFVAVSSVPLLGGLVELAALLLGLGALWFWLRGGIAPTTAAAPLQAARTAPMPIGR